MQTNRITKIDKSHVRQVPFRKEDVLLSKESKFSRQQELHRGMALGNLHKVPVRIQFENASEQAMETEATIWAVTEKKVVLKGGVMIPIHAVFNVTL